MDPAKNQFAYQRIVYSDCYRTPLSDSKLFRPAAVKKFGPHPTRLHA